MKDCSAPQTKEMLLAVTEAIIRNKPLLTEIDCKTGDGDHGIGMEIGMRQARESLLSLPESASVNELFKAMGRAMMMSMGGASGVMFGTLFQAGAKALPDAAGLRADTLSKMFRLSLEAVKKRGGAQPGDKTMVDALEPAVLAMEDSESEEIHVLLAAAAEAAARGVEETKRFAAKFGRAKSLMERSIGYQDAGATSVQIIFEAMSSYASKLYKEAIYG